MSEGSGNDQYNHGGMLAFVFSMVGVFAFMIYLVWFQGGVDLKENVIDPTKQVAAAAEAAFDMSAVAEPWVSSPEIVAYGKKFYSTNCAMCHGNEGKGDGPAGMGLNPRPRNLVEGKWKMGSGVTDLYNVVSNGIPGSSMAAFGHFKPADRWALVHFIQSITENKSKQDAAEIAAFAKTAK